MFLHVPSKCGSYIQPQNLIFNRTPFKNLVKMNVLNIRSWTSILPARSGPRLRNRNPSGGSSKTIGKPYVFEVPPLRIHWRPLSPGCSPWGTAQNLIIIVKPFKNLVKMNDFIIRSPATATERQSGPRHARAARGLRIKCVTWKSLKTHRETLCFQCAPKARRC